MSRWEQYDMTNKITTILSEVPETDHHFGRAYLSAYQIAIAFAQRYKGDFDAINLPVGGAGTGQHNSLSQYIAQRLSAKIRDGSLPHIEGSFISNWHLNDLTFDNEGEIIRSSLTKTQYTLSMYRLKEE